MKNIKNKVVQEIQEQTESQIRNQVTDRARIFILNRVQYPIMDQINKVRFHDYVFSETSFVG